MDASIRRNSNSAPKKPPLKLVVGIAAAALAAVLVGGYFGLCAWVSGNGQLLPGTAAVDGQGETVVNLGRLNQEDALSAVSQEMEQRLSDRRLTLLYGQGKRVEFTGELMACAPDAVVDGGLAAKKEAPFWTLGAKWLGLFNKPVQLQLSASTFTPEGEELAKKMIQSIAHELYVAPVDFTYELGSGAVQVIPGTDGQELDADALLAAVEEALAQGRTELQAEPSPIPGAELTGQVLSDLIHLEPQPAGVDEAGRLTPAVVGRSVNPEEAQAILDAAAPGEPVSIPLEYIPPETSGDERLYYKDLLAEVTTNLDGVATRSFNVARAAASCNGKVLQPGEVFSYLGTIGDPSARNGYQTSTGYQNGQTVAMDGGGVCQVSSCLYYCAVYSNLEIVNRACHAFATGYIPNGLDATVYYPSLDLKFRNSTGYPIKIVAYCTGGAYGTLTVQFYGSNPDGIRVDMERYALGSTPWSTVYEANSSIPRGTTRVKTTPYTGYSVEVYRSVYDASGNLLSRTFENRSNYAKRDKVILYNPADAANLGLPADPGAATAPDTSTAPDAATPPTAEPQVTQPPVTEPPVTQPPANEPQDTQPPVITVPPAEPPIVTPPPAPVPGGDPAPEASGSGDLVPLPEG